MISMDFVIFKVIFSAFEQFQNKNLSLSFKNLVFKKPIKLPAKFISELKNLSETNNDIIYFQNIEEVILIGNLKSNYSYNHYYVILYTLKSSGEKKGYLIGNVKKFGDILIGVWPFNKQLAYKSIENIIENYDDIIKKTHQYTKICVIS
ncbi:hypothetical protein LCGC14_1221290 [marine sediment metagenome]|uniref:Uncharacterized protein n=1 Tax=marine sediment metagenome TaxID=412755 RepID=A0A0F9LB56_9ZZZZ